MTWLQNIYSFFHYMLDVMAFRSYDALRDKDADNNKDIEVAPQQDYEFVILREKMIR